MTTTVEDLNARIDAAQAAFEKARGADLRTRASWPDAAATGLEKDADPLVDIAGRETHLAEARLRGPAASAGLSESQPQR